MKLFMFVSALLLVSYACTEKTPTKEFFLAEKVAVIGGFYKGCLGNIDSEGSGDTYWVNLSCNVKVEGKSSKLEVKKYFEVVESKNLERI